MDEETAEQSKTVDPNLSKLLANTFLSSDSLENATIVEKIEMYNENDEEEQKFEIDIQKNGKRHYNSVINKN